MLKESQGFVFSLDAFVSFALILLAIQSLLIISTTPAGYFRSLEQANYYSKDTLQSLSLVKYSDGRTLFGKVINNVLNNQEPPKDLLNWTHNLVPNQYSFAYDYYDFGSDKWVQIYNASDQTGQKPPYYDARHDNVTYNRVHATSIILLTDYTQPEHVGDSPYCNVVCKGYGSVIPYENVSDSRHAECVNVPCEPQIESTNDVGNFSVGLLRLHVWG